MRAMMTLSDFCLRAVLLLGVPFAVGCAIAQTPPVKETVACFHHIHITQERP